MRLVGAFLILVAGIVLIPIILSVAKWLLAVVALLFTGVVLLKISQMQDTQNEEDCDKNLVRKTWRDFVQLYHGKHK